MSEPRGRMFTPVEKELKANKGEMPTLGKAFREGRTKVVDFTSAPLPECDHGLLFSGSAPYNDRRRIRKFSEK